MPDIMRYEKRPQVALAIQFDTSVEEFTSALYLAGCTYKVEDSSVFVLYGSGQSWMAVPRRGYAICENGLWEGWSRERFEKVWRQQDA